MSAFAAARVVRDELTDRHKQHRRALAHHREPAVRAGLTASVYREIDNGLSAHELVKIKLAAEHRAARTDMVTATLAGTGALLVQRIGHIAVFYRRHPQKPKIILP